jgi:XTP/dITP diphosphohydrolase
MTSLLVATTNPHKLREIRGLLEDAPARVIGLEGVLPPLPEPGETGTTFRENACLKAQYYDRTIHALRHGEALHHTGNLLTVAEDSGLVIDALNGEPGVRSARYLRPDASYPERFEEIFRRLAVRPERPRTARFICALAVVRDGALVYETTGTVEGEIAPAPRGSAGFGYDPIFFYPPYRCTLAEVSEARKLDVAHRGRAFRALAEWLRTASSL